MDYDIIIIGGGASGLMAAASAASGANRVLLLEKNEKLGKKLYITGKGRCNITNACDIQGMLDATITNAYFLYSPFYALPPDALISLLNEAGVATKIERGNRVFPTSDKSSDVIAGLERLTQGHGAQVRLNAAVSAVHQADGGFCVTLDSETLTTRKVIITTGGLSYPATGSTGDGLNFACALGHKVTQTHPALVPLICAEKWAAELMGLSLKNVALTAKIKGRQVYGGFGELLFTHFGISGPLALSASAYIAGHSRAKVNIDLKPALDAATLNARLLRDFAQNQNRAIKNALDELLPKSLIPIIISAAGINPDKKIHSITKDERNRLIAALKGLEMNITGNRGYKEAVITAGGVDVKQIDPSTMESKLIPGLYFAGEVLDIHALTGGYNLQIAFCTGHLAGLSAAH